jgi:Fic family protein
METRNIWQPVSFEAEKWNTPAIAAVCAEFDLKRTEWLAIRADLSDSDRAEITERLKRRQAVETGYIEGMYILDRGITETLIERGFKEAYLAHDSTNIPQWKLMEYLEDNKAGIDEIFDFVKSDRELTVGYIKELHILITRHQDTTEAIDQFGNHFNAKLLKGEYKTQPNNPARGGVIYGYCPPEQVASQMDELIRLYGDTLVNAHIVIKAAFIHQAFTQIHPFQDGNGRCARLLAGIALIKDGMFPLIVDRSERGNYIDAIEAADSENYLPLIKFFAENQRSALNLMKLSGN